MFLTGLALVAALQQPVTPAQVAPGSSAPPAAVAATPDAAKPVCRRITETGSRLGGERICMTAQQWRERAREDAQNLENMQTNSRSTGPG